MQVPINAISISGITSSLVMSRFVERFDEPKVVADKSAEFDLNRECQTALSRLNVALEANVSYQKKLLQKEYDSKKHNQSQQSTSVVLGAKFIFGSPYTHGSGGGGGIKQYSNYDSVVSVPDHF